MTSGAIQREMPDQRTILGIRFFVGTAPEAVARMRGGGLLVVPAAPALKDLETKPQYREALLSSDLALADSAYMVMIWNRLQRDSIRRLSGLEYLRELLKQPELRLPGGAFWIMAGERSARRNLAWLRSQGIQVPEGYVYLAPIYAGEEMEDAELLQRIQKLCPRHVILTLGGGTQERVGLYLKKNLNYLPAIHCIGAAIAFLSGDQVRIPHWADRSYLGWLFRSISHPSRYVPRYWGARKLLSLLIRYRERLPVLQI
jgi:UDP-N-acetyl-D-mannosaminuronic acid transferase (WecB/TagA/CpsF family)